MFVGARTNVKASVRKLRGVAAVAIASALLLPCVALAQERGSLKEARRLSKQVRELHEQKRYKDAIPPAERLLRILTIKLGVAHPEYAEGLEYLARLYEVTGREAELEPLYVKALEEIQKAEGEMHPLYGIALGRLAAFYFNKQRYANAEPLLIKALELKRKAVSEQSLEYAESLDNLGALYYAMGRRAEVEPLLIKKIDVIRKAVGEQHPDYARNLNTLARLYDDMDRKEDADTILAKVLEVAGEKHPHYAAILTRLGRSYFRAGRYADAEPLFAKAVEAARKAVGEEHQDYAAALDDLAQVRVAMGQYSEAVMLYFKALEATRKAVGEEHPDFARALYSLALVYHRVGKFADIERVYLKALDVKRKASGEENIDYAKGLIALATLYMQTGRNAEAEPLLVKGVEVLRRAFGEQHIDYFRGANNLALLYSDTGRYAEAETLLVKGAEVARKALGEDHPEYAGFLLNLASVYEATGRPRDALATMSRAMSIEQLNLRRVFSATSEAAMFTYFSTVSNSLDALITLANVERRSYPEAIYEALTWTLRRKGLIFDWAVRFRRARLLAEGDPSVATTAARLRQLRQRLSDVTLSPPAGMSPEAVQQELLSIRAEADRFEAELNRALSSKIREQDEREVDIESVRRQLVAGSALIEFVRADTFEFKHVGKRPFRQPEHYFAFVLTATPKAPPRLIDLGDAVKIEKAVFKLREHVAATNNFLKGATERQLRAAERDREDSYRMAAKELYDLVFESVRRELGGAKTVYLSTDGHLSLVPFEALVADSAEGAPYLIEEYRFAYLTGGRDLLRVSPPAGRGAAVFADPDYDLNAEQRAAELKQLESQAMPPQKPAGGAPRIGGTADAPPAPSAPGLAGGGSYRSALPLDVRVRSGGLTWARLVNSAAEGADVSRMLGGTPYGSVADYVRGRASEDALKRVKSPRVLHLSTHGFFLPDLTERPPSEAAGVFGSKLQPPDGTAAVGLARLGAASNISPLLRSGFVLAGANRLDEQLPLSPQMARVEDGWVTAEEAALLDLSGTELAVLSACGTGLGTVPAGEGVYGLRRALRLAGVSTVVSTLFDVPDQESASLMRNFYNSLKSGQGKLEALRGAQLRLIRERREQGGAAHPFFWAGFVLSGDPN
jgi:CHAT domain-containing protein/tetratricopeptide (TPR) repeat protein